MKTSHSNDVVVGLDAGSSKVLCIVAEPADDGRYHVLGFGSVRSSGIRNGTVADVEAAVTSIREAVQEAQYTSGCRIDAVWASIGGKTLTSRNCSGVAVLRGPEVTQEDEEQAKLNARLNAEADGQAKQLLKLIPQGFRCGEAYAPKSAVGLAGQRCEALVHAVYGSQTNAENLKRCMQRAGLELLNYEPHSWSAAQAVLTETERICGVAVIDLGAETTSMSVFREGIVRFTDVRPWGAEYLTRDIAMVLGIDLDEAEELKISAGSCEPDKIREGEIVQAGRRERPYRRELVAKTLRARVKEFFGLYRKVLVEARLFDSVELVVLTGGGANLRGIDVVAAEVLGKRVRIGTPLLVDDTNPVLTTPEAVVALGLVRCAESGARLGDLARLGRRAPGGFLGRLRTLMLGDY